MSRSMGMCACAKHTLSSPSAESVDVLELPREIVKLTHAPASPQINEFRPLEPGPRH